MERTHRRRIILASVLTAGLGMSSAAFGDDFHGVIYQHGNDGTIRLLTDDSADMTVVVSDSTRVRRVDGVRSRKVSTASLIPGLRVEVTGGYGDDRRFLARRVTFRKSDEKIARAIQGGLSPTELRMVANQQRIEQQARTLRQQEQQIAANEAKIVATAGMAAASAARITNLDDYDVIGSMTVYFANGESTVPSTYRRQIESMIAQAKTAAARGYVVQVQGYASAVGADALNERLSSERAEAVARILQQNGVPPTNLAPPAGMGTSLQVAPNKTEKEQAENRRVVITILRNKGITGK